MNPVLLGQLLGISFACGLNLYATVAALGLLSRLGVIHELPPGLQGLEGSIVIASAVVLYVVEAVVDKVRHADSLWDTVHTFIRPPAAALLAVGALWTAPLEARIGGAIFALLVALAAHGTKAGLRLALNAAQHRSGHVWISVAEDLAAVAFAVAALEYPASALIAGAVVLAILIPFGPRLWRAFSFGIRCLAAWFRALFTRSRWREAHELPRDLRAALGDTPMGAPPPRGTRVGILGAPGIAAYRNGWLVLTRDGPAFAYRTLLGTRMAPLPAPRDMAVELGPWADMIRVNEGDTGGEAYTLYLLKDGPAVDTAVSDLGHAGARLRRGEPGGENDA